MTKDDDRYEYVKGTYKYKKGSTPDQSRETAGAWRGTLRDDGGHLDGQAEFIPGDEDEYDNEPVYIYANEQREADARSRERSELEELLGNLMILGVLVAFEKAEPHVKRWWSEQAVPAVKSAWNKLARRREARSQVVVAESVTVSVEAPEDTGQEVVAALEAYKASMSSAEARDRFVAALMARLFSDEQLRILRDARIEHGEGPHALERAAEAVTAQQVGESITLMLEANPSLLNEQTLTDLGQILGLGRADGEDVPMRREQIHRALRLTDGRE
ncbi:MAG: hypothetical protein ABW167_21760 [Baekduia sp.]